MTVIIIAALGSAVEALAPTATIAVALRGSESKHKADILRELAECMRCWRQ